MNVGSYMRCSAFTDLYGGFCSNCILDTCYGNMLLMKPDSWKIGDNGVLVLSRLM